MGEPKRLGCRVCRASNGVPEHIRLIVDAHNYRYGLPDEQKDYFDWLLNYKSKGLYTHPVRID